MAFVVDMRDTECPNQTYVISVWWYTVRADGCWSDPGQWLSMVPLSFPNYFFISVFLVEESSDTAPGSLILQAFFSLRLKVLQKWINSDHTIWAKNYTLGFKTGLKSICCSPLTQASHLIWLIIFNLVKLHIPFLRDSLLGSTTCAG